MNATNFIDRLRINNPFVAITSKIPSSSVITLLELYIEGGGNLFTDPIPAISSDHSCFVIDLILLFDFSVKVNDRIKDLEVEFISREVILGNILESKSVIQPSHVIIGSATPELRCEFEHFNICT